MIQARERLAGFDARELWLDPSVLWTSARKDSFLYRLDVNRPMSVDPRVWPSVFDADGRIYPPERFGYQSLWADLEALRRALSVRLKVHPNQAFRAIAVTLLLGDYCATDKIDWDSRIPTPFPDLPTENSAWPLLGYDVGDQWMLSALSNCGFIPEYDDVAALRGRWGPVLNEHHLFDDLGQAIEFKQMSDIRLQEDHAPCFIFGIRSVPLRFDS